LTNAAKVKDDEISDLKNKVEEKNNELVIMKQIGKEMEDELKDS